MKPARTKDGGLPSAVNTATPNNLPAQLTSFIGREEAIAEVGRLITEARIVTLTGSGGCGKTRLALQAGARILDSFPDGVWWVDLSPLTDPALVPSAAAAALSIREVSKQPLAETIANGLRDRRALIVLDNCEHLVEACAGFAATILRSCPGVSILATSRHTIDVEGEVAFRVPSLELPDEGGAGAIDAMTQYEAVRLFIDRAVQARPNFRVTNENAPAVAHICHRLDGIPLAIELAAARTRMLSVERIADELTDVFRVLTGGARTAVPRHQTLRASVEWSFGLLTDDERALLRRLSVFAGGFSLDGAEEVVSGQGLERNRILDLLSGLVDKSLVQVEDSGPDVRYRLLETIRQHGAEELADAGEVDATRNLHLAFFIALAERAQPELEGAGMLEWVRILRAEHDNIRAALDWSYSSGQPDQGLRLAGPLGIFWYAGGYWSEACRRYEALLAEEDIDRTLMPWALLGIAANSHQLLDWPVAQRRAEEALSIAREIDDPRAVARALTYMATGGMWSGDFRTARPLWEEAIGIARETGDLFTLSMAYWGLANGTWVDQGDLTGSRAHFEESLSTARESGNPLRIGMALSLFGLVAVRQGDLDRAETLAEEAIPLLDELGEQTFRIGSQATLALVETFRGNHDEAERQVNDALRLATDVPNPPSLGWLLFVRGTLLRSNGDLEAAAEAFEDSARFGRLMGIPAELAFFLTGLAQVHVDRNDLERAEAVLEEASAALGDTGGFFRGVLADVGARLARERGSPERAETLAHEALALLTESDAKPWILDLLELVAWTAAAHESHAEAARLFAAVEAARGRLGCVRFRSSQARYEEDIELARSALGPEGFEKTWAEGAAMSLEEAVAYARRGRGERKRPSTGWASLTPTELEVAGLVAERLTNPQIAERLFVSRGTVKAHLSHIYSKLDIASRAELADRVAEHRP